MVKSSVLQSLLQRLKQTMILVAVFSALVNLLMLTVPIYMLQLFDRVLVGQSTETLMYLTVIAVVALATMSLLDVVRGRVLTRVAEWFEKKLSLPALQKSPDSILAGGQYGRECLRDIGLLRQFLSGTAVYSILDIPWAPIFILITFFLSPILGAIALVGAFVLMGIAVAHVRHTNQEVDSSNQSYQANQFYVDSALKNSEVIEAMGMLHGIINKWYHRNEDIIEKQVKASNRGAELYSLSKFIRLVLQIAILGTGAYFAMQGELTPGAMIACSIIVSRALAPIEQAIGAWRQASMAKQAFERLDRYFNAPSSRTSTLDLPKVKGILTVEKLLFVSPESKKVLLQGIHFQASPGEIVAIVGPSGAGKSTLARLILGLWPASRGTIRLDGADVFHWDRINFGKQVGFLPQKASLFSGTVKDNVCRLLEGPEDEPVLKATKAVGAHEMILRMPNGYDTEIKEYSLSGGQERRIALARAFYGNPRVLLLDEPEANLDQEGIHALLASIKKAKKDNQTVILISQSREVIQHADKLLVIAEGKMQSFGPNQTASGLEKAP